MSEWEEINSEAPYRRQSPVSRRRDVRATVVNVAATVGVGLTVVATGLGYAGGEKRVQAYENGVSVDVEDLETASAFNRLAYVSQIGATVGFGAALAAATGRREQQAPSPPSRDI